MLYALLGFLVSPQGLPLLLFLFFVLPFSVYLFRKKQRSAVLQKHFQGHFSFIDGLWFHFLGNQFCFSEQGRSAGSVEYGGIRRQPLLWTFTETHSSFFCAGADIKKYQFRWNLASCPHEQSLTILGKELLLGAETEAFLASMVQQVSENPAVAQAMIDLVQKPGSYLKATKETIIGHGACISKKTVLRYFMMDSEIYSNPHIIENALKNILTIQEGFGIGKK